METKEKTLIKNLSSVVLLNASGIIITYILWVITGYVRAVANDYSNSFIINALIFSLGPILAGIAIVVGFMKKSPFVLGLFAGIFSLFPFFGHHHFFFGLDNFLKLLETVFAMGCVVSSLIGIFKNYNPLSPIVLFFYVLAIVIILAIVVADIIT